MKCHPTVAESGKLQDSSSLYLPNTKRKTDRLPVIQINDGFYLEHDALQTSSFYTFYVRAQTTRRLPPPILTMMSHVC